MDVYEVVDAPSFIVSADQALNPELTPSPTPTSLPSLVDDIVDSEKASGVEVHRYSLLLLSVSLVTVLAALML